MQHTPIINELILHQNADYAESQGIIPELLFKLIAASIQNPKELRLPSIVNQPGWDGIVNSPISFDPFVPEGKSFWEIGVGNNPGDKATKDFRKRNKEMSATERAESTYVFVTPRSASTAGGWDIKKQEQWKKRRANSGWKDIKIIDGTRIQHWLSQFPEIDKWLAEKFNILDSTGYESPSLYWKILENYGAPPPLLPKVFTEGRETFFDEIMKVLQGDVREIKIETLFPEEAVDYVIAMLKSLSPKEQATYAGRCLVVDNAESWKKLCTIKQPYVLIAKPILDLGGTGSELRSIAKTYRKGIIFSSTPSASTHGNSFKLPEIKAHQLKSNLQACGYSEERARSIAEKSKGRITTLKRLLVDISASPQWANSDTASELAIASLIGQWDANGQGDIIAVGNMLGEQYGEWIRKIRPLTLIPDPPLIQQNEKWHFISRYEGWQNLGKYISDEDIRKFSEIAIEIFKEKDPKFDLPNDERWMASVKGKKALYSDYLKTGIAETLALMGTYPKALSSTSVNLPEMIVAQTLRDILKNSDWVNLASLNNYLPFFAEADPDIFLEAIEEILTTNKIAIKNLFEQEGNGITGWNYMTGILWGLEALAWDEKYIVRVSLILSELSSIDPGGSWSNRPFNSLITIFLPWIKQTCASIEKKIIAIKTVANEFPDVAWELLISILPHPGSVTSGSHKPIWREYIPIDFTPNVTKADYWKQIRLFSDTALEIAKMDFEKLKEFAKELDRIPEPTFSLTLSFIESLKSSMIEEKELFELWEILSKLIRKHRKFHDAEWALPNATVLNIESVNDKIKPSNPLLLYRYLFDEGDFDLAEEKGNYSSQKSSIESMRTNTLEEIFSNYGAEATLEFAKNVKFPFEVGAALGRNRHLDLESQLINNLLDKPDKFIKDFIRGYIWNKFSIDGFAWVEKLNFEEWDSKSKLDLLTILPFYPETWEKVKLYLGKDEVLYWKYTDASPYNMKKDELQSAIINLLQFDRPRAAIKNLQWMLHLGEIPSVDLVYQALLSDLAKDGDQTPIDSYAVTEIIKWVQKQKDFNEEKLGQIEWIYLPLLGKYSQVKPKVLHSKLASDPTFFGEVISTVFRSEKEPEKTIIDENKKELAEQAYLLLQDWNVIPGLQEDDNINDKQLLLWLQEIKTLCSESGHLRVALSTIGRIFAHAPADPNGLWIHKSIAEILNNRDHKEMRDGFTTELFNMRGVFYGSSGNEERNLAKNYREKAILLENEGLTRLSTSINDLARTYELDAAREEATDNLDL